MRQNNNRITIHEITKQSLTYNSSKMGHESQLCKNVRKKNVTAKGTSCKALGGGTIAD